MIWFRILGATMMTLGSALAAAAITLASIILDNFIDWSRNEEARAFALITLPSFVLGVALVGGGRLADGGWLDRAPLRRVAALIVQIVGALITLGLGVMFLLLILAGVGPQDRSDATSFGLGMLAGLALLFLGVWLKPGRSAIPHERD
ncbi:MAG: hypothetical protein ABI740_06230 [Alphaproteobacteria bacterium]